MRRRSLALLVLAGWFLAWPAPPGLSQTDPNDGSPLTGRNVENQLYPDASRWPGGELEKGKGKIPPEELDSRVLADPGSKLGRLLRVGLPAGLTLSEGAATWVMADSAAAEEVGVRGAEKWFVVYPFNYRGVRVAKYSDAFAVVGAEGDVLYVRKRNVPVSVDASVPTVSAEAALAVARQRARETFGPIELEESQPKLEIWVEPSLSGRLAWTLTIESTSLADPKARRYWVAAVGQPQVLQVEDLVYFGHFGTVRAEIWESTPQSRTSILSLPEVQLTRDPGGAMQATGLDGRYSYPDGTGTATITSSLVGRLCVVHNVAGCEMVAKNSGSPGSPIDLIFSASTAPRDLQRAQTSAYFWTNASYQFVRSILDSLPASLYEKLPVNANLPGSCDAFFKATDLGVSTNFYVAGCRCPNTAYSDVIVHEYGHAVDHWRGEIDDAPYSEGFSDAMAILLTRQPCFGRAFFGEGTCYREANAVDMWPPSIIREGNHAQGKRYAQFVWQLVQQLRKTLTEDTSFRLAQHLVLAAAASDPSGIPDAVKLSFIADDNDGDLTNGTPHCKELAAAANSRTIPLPPSLVCP